MSAMMDDHHFLLFSGPGSTSSSPTASCATIAGSAEEAATSLQGSCAVSHPCSKRFQRRPCRKRPRCSNFGRQRGRVEHRFESSGTTSSSVPPLSYCIILVEDHHSSSTTTRTTTTKYGDVLRLGQARDLCRFCGDSQSASVVPRTGLDPAGKMLDQPASLWRPWRKF